MLPPVPPPPTPAGALKPGGTEVGTATLATPQDWLEHPGCVGVPTPGTRMAFYDEQGQRVPEGEIG